MFVLLCMMGGDEGEEGVDAPYVVVLDGVFVGLW